MRRAINCVTWLPKSRIRMESSGRVGVVIASA